MGDIAQLTPDKRNANKGTLRGRALLEDSLRRYGAGRSILADKHGQVIAGNKTLESAADIGLPVRVIETDGTELVVVRRTDLDLDTDKSARELAYADNRVAALDLDWDVEALLADRDAGIDLAAVGFDAHELAALLVGVDTGTEGLTDPDAVPPVPAVPVTQPGDLWVLGRHRLACIDCTDVGAVEQLLAGTIPAMVFADPPYGIDIVDVKGWVGGGAAYDIPFGGVKNREGLGTANGPKPFGSKAVRGSVGASNMVEVGRYAPVIGDDSTETAIAAYGVASLVAPSAVHVWWGGNYYANALPASSCWLVWDKQNTGNFADAELAWTNRPTAVRIFRHMWNGLMKASERGERRVHPTQKPVALAAWCFDSYGHDGDVILDPFVGSGMSIIAAEQSDRIVVGCELSPAYCDVIVARWEAFTGQKATRQ